MERKLECWLWPDKIIGKEESKILRQEHNALVNDCCGMLEALKEIHKLWCCPNPKRIKDYAARCDVMADFARTAIAKAEGRM